jgi:cytochrome c-type biogenesis protein CcmF
MQIFGSYAVLLALVLAGYSLTAGIIGLMRRNGRLVSSAMRAAMGIFPAVTVAVLCLVGLILRDDFTISYVAEHSNRALPIFYKVAVLWSGQEGSLLFWSWILAGYAFIVMLTSARAHRDLRALAAVILAGVQFFFLLLNNFVASAFVSIPVVPPPDGNGLNPLLQYSEMIFHPPMLYLGYVGFSVPFAFALAALIKRYPGDRWIHVTRRWTMVAWCFLSVGIVLGGLWAYSVLGWGGYWAWDPVENASFLPWLMGTAFLHSVMMQEKRGMLKIWNVWLVFGTFMLSIFGTFLTRSGVVSSVHAFAQSSIGSWFVVFLALVASICVYFFMRNRDFLKSEATLETTMSRESSFLFNNFILLVAVFAVLWGTLFPVLSEAVEGTKISVGREFFDRITVPLFLFLLLLTGLGPLLAWRRTSLGSLKKNFLVPGALGLGVSVACVAAGLRDAYADVAFGLATFVVLTVLSEFLRGALVIARRSGRNLASAVVQLTMRNTRRYGGYIVHLGVVIVFIGIAGSAFNRQAQGLMPYRGQMTIGPYTLTSRSYTQDDNDNYSSQSLIIAVSKHGHQVGTLYPSRRFYKSSQQEQSMVAIRHTPLEDLYLVYRGDDPTTNQPVLQAYLNPLVGWVWIGAMILVFGTIIALLPNRKPEPSSPKPVPNAVEQREMIEA